jgi:hypothetical protein
VISLQTWPDSPQSIVVIGLVALAIMGTAALIISLLQKKMRILKSRRKFATFPPQYQNFHHETKLIRKMVPVVQSQRAHKTPALRIEEVELLSGREDITRSLMALVEKYSLITFTIATSDGLVFASSGGDDANINAATYTTMALRDPLTKTTMVIIPGLIHKGSDLVGIIRTQNPLEEEILMNITKDTQTILNWWV